MRGRRGSRIQSRVDRLTSERVQQEACAFSFSQMALKLKREAVSGAAVSVSWANRNYGFCIQD
jgi:hypothetical protein